VKRLVLSFVVAPVGVALLVGCSALVDLSGLSTDGTPAAMSSDARSDALVTSDGGGSGDGALPGTDAATDATSKPCHASGTVENVKEGPNSAVDDARIGSIAWTGTAGVSANDGVSARSASMNGDVITHWLISHDFGLALPAGAFVRGFTVGVVHSAGSTDEIVDHGVALVKGGTIGTPRSLLGAWPTTKATATYGSPTDTWGLTFSADDVNATDFGVAIAARGNPAFDERAAVDYVEVTVYFERCVP